MSIRDINDLMSLVDEILSLVDELSESYGQDFMGQTVAQIMGVISEADQERVNKVIKTA